MVGNGDILSLPLITNPRNQRGGEQGLIMATGMITAGTQPLYKAAVDNARTGRLNTSTGMTNLMNAAMPIAQHDVSGLMANFGEEERSDIASAIATILMQMRAGGISQQLAAQFFADMVGNGVPPQMIEKEIARDMEGAGEAIPVNQMPTEVRTPRPTMASYGDVRSLLAPGSNVTSHVDRPDIGWPGEDFRNIPEKLEEVKKTIPIMGDDFGGGIKNRNPVGRAAPPVSSYVRPASSFVHEDVKAQARSRGTPTRTSPGPVPMPGIPSVFSKFRGGTPPVQMPSITTTQPARSRGRVSRRGNPHAR